jgi:L-amino acid N-acyltransferase YncA
MDIRPVAEIEPEALAAFFAAVPEGDRTSFKEDVLDPSVVASWAQPRDDEQRVVAVDEDGAVAGWLAVIGGVAWSAHVGDVRLVVAPGRRGQGLGRTLARHALVTALGHGYSKLVVDVVADRTAAMSMFADLGFQPEALLVEHVRDPSGELRDLVVLAHHAEQVWEDLAAVGIDAELRP